MRIFQLCSEKSVLAEVRFHGTDTSAAGEVHIEKGTEATVRAIIDRLYDNLPLSVEMSKTAAKAEAKSAKVVDLQHFRKLDGRS